jgi:hypothetical protein
VDDERNLGVCIYILAVAGQHLLAIEEALLNYHLLTIGVAVPTPVTVPSPTVTELVAR